ncbi:hypothetical protein IAT38_007184 [Cryptococcus sp. DSM 104549]
MRTIWFEDLEKHCEDTTVATTYPAQRYSYSLISPSDAYDQMTLRTAKYMVHELIHDGPSIFKWKWSDPNFVTPNFDLSERLIKQSLGKKGATMEEYTGAWGILMPWHSAAFPPDDPVRAKLGKFESSTFANLAAVYLTMSRRASSGTEERHQCEDIAFKCVWASLADREYATANTVRNACRRARELVDKQRGPFGPGREDGILKMWEYYDARADALEGLPKDMMFNDVDEERKIAPPPANVQHLFGPRQWQKQFRAVWQHQWPDPKQMPSRVMM